MKECESAQCLTQPFLCNYSSFPNYSKIWLTESPIWLLLSCVLYVLISGNKFWFLQGNEQLYIGKYKDASVSMTLYFLVCTCVVSIHINQIQYMILDIHYCSHQIWTFPKSEDFWLLKMAMTEKLLGNRSTVCLHERMILRLAYYILYPANEEAFICHAKSWVPSGPIV